MPRGKHTGLLMSLYCFQEPLILHRAIGSIELKYKIKSTKVTQNKIRIKPISIHDNPSGSL